MTGKDAIAISNAIALALDRYHQYRAPGGTHHGQAVEFVRNDVLSELQSAVEMEAKVLTPGPVEAAPKQKKSQGKVAEQTDGPVTKVE